jgi:hypothetical protein
MAQTPQRPDASNAKSCRGCPGMRRDRQRGITGALGSGRGIGFGPIYIRTNPSGGGGGGWPGIGAGCVPSGLARGSVCQNQSARNSIPASRNAPISTVMPGVNWRFCQLPSGSTRCRPVIYVGAASAYSRLVSIFARLKTSKKWYPYIWASMFGSSRTSTFKGAPRSLVAKNSTCSELSSRAPYFALTSAARWFANAARSSALAVSLLAWAVCSSSAEVRHSDWSSRMLDVRHWSSRNAMPAHAPMAVITPAANNPFQAIGYQYSAQASNAGSIGAESETIWFWSAIFLIALSPTAASRLQRVR